MLYKCIYFVRNLIYQPKEIHIFLFSLTLRLKNSSCQNHSPRVNSSRGVLTSKLFLLLGKSQQNIIYIYLNKRTAISHLELMAQFLFSKGLENFEPKISHN